MPTGPPPQAVLDQRWMWNILLFILGVTLILRLIGLDIAGALLTGLMLCFGIIMTRDGMQEMAKYALVYAVLCGLNFFFDILPLITELGGRVTRTTEPVTATTSSHGIQQMTYTMTTKTTPFFDSREGLVYNVQSLGMVISPVAMALGVYLSISANYEIQRLAPPLLGEEEDMGWNRPMFVGTGNLGSQPQPGGAAAPPDAPRPSGGAQAAAAPAGGQTPSRTNVGRDSFERFTGTGHKLS